MLEQCKSSLLKGTTLTHQPEIAPSGNVIWYDMEWLNKLLKQLLSPLVGVAEPRGWPLNLIAARLIRDYLIARQR